MRLAGPKLKHIDCATTFQGQIKKEEEEGAMVNVFAGDPGSILLVLCPPKCKDFGSVVVGIGI